MLIDDILDLDLFMMIYPHGLLLNSPMTLGYSLGPPVVTRRPSVCDLSVPWQRQSGPRPDTARDDTRRGAPKMAKLMNITNSNDFSLWYIDMISSYIYGTYTVVNGIVNQRISCGATKSHRRTVHDLWLLIITTLLSLDID